MLEADLDELVDALAEETRVYVEKRLAELRAELAAEFATKMAARGLDDLEIVETIHPQRSYPGGTFALHGGGMVLALRDTNPLSSAEGLEDAGWKVVQDGIADIRRGPDEDDTATIIVERTSGEAKAFRIEIARGLIDKGVHRPGMRYRAGDAVTSDESYWVCRKDTKSTPPHDDWRLIIKGKRRR
jgi:hypothetical protein